MNDSMNIRIRDMQVQDIPKVRNLWQSVNIELTYSDKYEELERMIKHNPSLCLVLIKQGKDKKSRKEKEEKEEEDIIGAVLGGFDGRRGWIHHLAVNPIYQRKNYGNIIMHELLQRFKDMGVVKLKLEVFRSNSGVINFYKKLGWDHRTDLTTMSFTLKE